MRLFAACLVAAGILSYGAQAQAQQCERVLSIGAWNIEWLGNPGKRKRDLQSAADIAAYIAAAKVDVLALEEISVTHRTTESKVARNKPLDDAFDILNKSGAKWRYEIFPKRKGARDENDQWPGVAWNAATVDRAGAAFKLDIKIDAKRESALRKRISGVEEDETVIFSRWPHVVRFSVGAGKTDFAIVTIHMKSNNGGKATAEARDYEAELLVAALATYANNTKERDIIVLGDTNMLLADEDAGRRFTSAGYRDCNAKDTDTYFGSSSSPFDRIFLNPLRPGTRDTCPAAGSGSASQAFATVPPSTIKMTQKQFRERLSDHVMIKAGICVQKDDD